MTSSSSGYTLYKTLDKSFTLKNNSIDENYHSNAGAYQEAKLKYFDGCDIMNRASKSEIRIFEVGFGLGYNILPILDHTKHLSNKITYITTEYDFDLFDELLDKIVQLYPQKYHSFFAQLLNEKKYSSDIFDINILEGDVRHSIKKIDTFSVDVIFHDPFSPYKNTECWTKDFFEQEYRILKHDGILSTYSISTPVRSGMYQAGFDLWEGIGDETKSSGTIATKSKLDGLTLLSDHMENKLHISPERIPFRDEHLNLKRDVIKQARLDKKSKNDYSDCIRK